MKRYLYALFGALVLVASAVATVVAADPTYATVTGYASGTEDNNHEDTWAAFTPEDDTCVKVAEDQNLDTYVLPALGEGQVYTLVVVKAGSDASTDFANTLFADAAAGETVWADSNGNGLFDLGGPDGDKTISHVIVCTGTAEETSTPTPTPTESATPTASETPSESPTPSETAPGTPPRGGGVTPAPTPTVPNTATAPYAPVSVPFVVLALVLTVLSFGGLVYARLRR